MLVLAIIEGPPGSGPRAEHWPASPRRHPMTAFTLLERRTEGPLLDVRVFRIRASPAGLSPFGGFLLPVRVHLPHHAVLPVRQGLLDVVGGPAHAAVRIRRRHATPIAAVVASRWGAARRRPRAPSHGGWTRRDGFDSEANTGTSADRLAMVLLALGLSSITAPTAEAVMGSVSDEQRGAAAGVNNTTRELGGRSG